MIDGDATAPGPRQRGVRLLPRDEREPDAIAAEVALATVPGEAFDDLPDLVALAKAAAPALLAPGTGSRTSVARPAGGASLHPR